MSFEANLLKVIAETHEINLRTKGYSISSDGIPFAIDGKTGQARMVQLADLNTSLVGPVPTAYKPPPQLPLQWPLMGHPMGFFGQLSQAAVYAPVRPPRFPDLKGHPTGMFGQFYQNQAVAVTNVNMNHPHCGRYVSECPHGRGPLEFSRGSERSWPAELLSTSSIEEAEVKALKDYKKQAAEFELMVSSKNLHESYDRAFDLSTRHFNQVPPPRDVVSNVIYKTQLLHPLMRK